MIEQIKTANPLMAFVQGRQAKQAEQKQSLDMQTEMGEFLRWAETPEQWDQGVSYFEQNGIPQAAALRGGFGLRPLMQGAVGNTNDPAALREWAAFKAMSPEEQAQYLTMKRASPVTNIAGVPTQVGPTGVKNPLSSLDAEADAAATLEGAKTAGRAAAEHAAGAPKRVERARQQIAAIDNTFTAIDKATGQADWNSTGFIGSMLRNIAGTDAFDLNSIVTTVKANIGFDRLQAMRDASPTGGALGQVAVQELEALQASIAALDTAQSREQFIEHLQAVRNHYENWKDAVLQSQTEAESQTAQPRRGRWNPDTGQVEFP